MRMVQLSEVTEVTSKVIPSFVPLSKAKSL